jgi:hypothetical protein
MPTQRHAVATVAVSLLGLLSEGSVEDVVEAIRS